MNRCFRLYIGVRVHFPILEDKMENHMANDIGTGTAAEDGILAPSSNSLQKGHSNIKGCMSPRLKIVLQLSLSLGSIQDIPDIL